MAAGGVCPAVKTVLWQEGNNGQTKHSGTALVMRATRSVRLEKEGKNSRYVINSEYRMSCAARVL